MPSSSTVVSLRQPDEVEDPLTAVLRSGARRLLAQAIEAEAETFLATMKDLRLPDGRDRVVRHGLGPERAIQTGIGAVGVRRVKLRDRGAVAGGRIRFTSAILPRWARRTRSLARDLGGPGPRDGRGCDCDVRREVWGQVREGGHLPGQGSPRVADLLRLPGRALGPLAHVQPGRERVRHGAAPDGAHQGCAVPRHRSPDGVQAGHGGRQDLASAEGREPVAQSSPRRHIP